MKPLEPGLTYPKSLARLNQNVCMKPLAPRIALSCLPALQLHDAFSAISYGPILLKRDRYCHFEGGLKTRRCSLRIESIESLIHNPYWILFLSPGRELHGGRELNGCTASSQAPATSLTATSVIAPKKTAICQLGWRAEYLRM